MSILRCTCTGCAVGASARHPDPQSGAPSGALSRLTALFAAQLRRAWGVTAVREMARHRLARIPLIGATRGTRLAQVFAPLA
eukprot:scaffold9552_cov113-Isochrysis_galbana.AAC.6